MLSLFGLLGATCDVYTALFLWWWLSDLNRRRHPFVLGQAWLVKRVWKNWRQRCRWFSSKRFRWTNKKQKAFTSAPSTKPSSADPPTSGPSISKPKKNLQNGSWVESVFCCRPNQWFEKENRRGSLYSDNGSICIHHCYLYVYTSICTTCVEASRSHSVDVGVEQSNCMNVICLVYRDKIQSYIFVHPDEHSSGSFSFMWFPRLRGADTLLLFFLLFLLHVSGNPNGSV